MIATALALARKGIAVFPCRPREKRPATENGLKDATTDRPTIERWWRLEPHYNIAIATGAISKMFAVDVDGFEAEFELRKLETEHGPLPATIETITARGRHLYFKYPDTLVRNSVGRIAPGVDVRGDGGYVLAPPSFHPCGRRYCWSVDSAKLLADAPPWLLIKISARAGGKTCAAPVAEWRKIAVGGAEEGTRDCTIAKLTGYLLRRRIDPIVVAALMHCFNNARCTPPLPEKDVSRIVNSIAGAELRRRHAYGG
jgi:hypothetical protein